MVFLWFSYCQSHELLVPSLQWEIFRIQQMEVPIPYIFQAYLLGLFFRPMFAGISPQNMAKHMVLTYLHLLDPGDLPLIPPLFHTRPEVEQLRSDGNKQGEAQCSFQRGVVIKTGGITNPLNGPTHWMVIWVWVNTYRYIFSGMNIHLPTILGFTRGTRFWPIPI